MRLTIPWTGPEELDAVRRVLDSGHLTQGPVAREFEAHVAALVGVPHALATSSCTTALHLALVGLGVGPGDDVVIPDFTFPATANAVAQTGARVRVADIDPDTFALDAESLAAVITPATRVVIPVHAFGLCADMDPISAICRDHGVAVVEDAACALGSEYHGRPAGSLGDLACFSFHPRKIITTGEGGMITTTDGDVAERLRLLSTHGGRAGELFPHFEVPGFNYRMSDIQAAIGLVQLSRLGDILAARRRAAEQYSEVLSGIEGVRPPLEPAGYRHTYQSYVVMTDPGIDRDQTIRTLRQRGIECTLGTYSVSRQAAFQGTATGDGVTPVTSWLAYDQAITLPLFPQMTEEDVQMVAVTLRESLAWR